MSISLCMVLVAMFVTGAFVGRFLAACAVRFPDHESLTDQILALRRPWGVCARCQTVVSGLQTVPILGWFLQRRCRTCDRRLSLEYPFIEFATACLFAALYYAEIPSGLSIPAVNGLTSVEGPRGPEVITTLFSPLVWLHLRLVVHLMMICGLVVATAIDRRLRIIPDGCTVPVMVIAVIASGCIGQLYTVPLWFQDASTVRILKPVMPAFLQPLFIPWDPTDFIQAFPRLHGWLVSLLGLIAGAGSVWIVRQIGFLVLRQEAMGFGDVVLMAMIGSVLGWQPVLTVFILAPALAIFAAVVNWVAHRDNEIPYGPFLSAATIILLLTWSHTWPMAKRFFDMGPFLAVMVVFMMLLLVTSLQLVQLIKRLLGFRSSMVQDHAGWTSADHLSYYNSERPDEQTNQWPREISSICRSGRGLQREYEWRRQS